MASRQNRAHLSGAETHPPAHSPTPSSRYRRRGVIMVVGLLALLGLVFVGVWGFVALTGLGCNGEERAVTNEFPHYGDRQIEPYSGEVSCNVRYPARASKEEILTYYVDRLRENGWELRTFPYREVLTEETLDALLQEERPSIIGYRGDYKYAITYFPPGTGDPGETPAGEEVSSEDAEVLVEVDDEPEPSRIGPK